METHHAECVKVIQEFGEQLYHTPMSLTKLIIIVTLAHPTHLVPYSGNEGA